MRTDPLITTVLDLNEALGGRADLLIGGGIGLYLKQRHLQESDARHQSPGTGRLGAGLRRGEKNAAAEGCGAIMATSSSHPKRPLSLFKGGLSAGRPLQTCHSPGYPPMLRQSSRSVWAWQRKPHWRRPPERQRA